MAARHARNQVSVAQSAGMTGAAVALVGATAGLPAVAVAGLAVEVVCVVRVIGRRWRNREHA